MVDYCVVVFGFLFMEDLVVGYCGGVMLLFWNIKCLGGKNLLVRNGYFDELSLFCGGC